MVHILAKIVLVGDESVDIDHTCVKNHSGDLGGVGAHYLADTWVDGVADLLLAHVDICDAMDGGHVAFWQGNRGNGHRLLLHWYWLRHLGLLVRSLLRLGHRLTAYGLRRWRHVALLLLAPCLGLATATNFLVAGILLVASLLVH